jgi:hypothetical protein
MLARDRILAAVVTTGVAVVLAFAVFGRGCAEGDSTPEGTVRAFVAAARDSDKHAMWALLGPTTRHDAEARARAATERAGSNTRFTALDMIDVAVPDSTYEPSDVVLRERHGDQAIVDVLGPAGRRDEGDLVRVGKKWRVELRTGSAR